MDLLWPGYLLLLLIIPLLIAAYIWLQRRRRRFALRFSSLSLLRSALPRQSKLRRHIPFGLILLALTNMIAAAARPVAITTVPSDQTTILLVMDVSSSMRFVDIAPSRLGAAEAAAVSFIRRQKPSMQIGLVAFSSYAELIQAPTADRDALQNAIESLTTGRRTAIGSGILKALEAIAEIDPAVAPIVSETSENDVVTPVPQGAYVPEIIVLLTDGVANAGPVPLDAAKQAADRGVRVYTIGFGTENGPQGNPFGSQSTDGGFGNQQSPNGNNNFFQGRGFRRGIDEQAMKEIAALTGGEYYAASNADELNKVFQSLPTHLITRHEAIEISFAFAALGALCALAAGLLSFRWQPLP